MEQNGSWSAHWAVRPTIPFVKKAEMRHLHMVSCRDPGISTHFLTPWQRAAWCNCSEKTEFAGGEKDSGPQSKTEDRLFSEDIGIENLIVQIKKQNEIEEQSPSTQ